MVIFLQVLKMFKGVTKPNTLLSERGVYHDSEKDRTETKILFTKAHS